MRINWTIINDASFRTSGFYNIIYIIPVTRTYKLFFMYNTSCVTVIIVNI